MQNIVKKKPTILEMGSIIRTEDIEAGTVLSASMYHCHMELIKVLISNFCLQNTLQTFLMD